MRRILVTGATGTVGGSVLMQLRDAGILAVAGVSARSIGMPGIAPAVQADFELGPPAETDFDAIFLMRPPALSDPDLFVRFLRPFPRSTRIVVLSVAGAESRSYLPHARIERAVSDLGFETVAIRPVYFMDNLVTTLAPDLAETGEIVLPSGDLPFDWVSARDVAALAVHALVAERPPRALTAAGGGRMGFAEICDRINGAIGTDLRYRPIGPARYVRRCLGRGMGWPHVAVMLFLHWLPRLQRRPAPVAGDIATVLGRPAETPEAFARREAARFRALLRPGADQATRSSTTDPTE